MHMTIRPFAPAVLAAAALLSAAPASRADIINATITADNHYAVYSTDGAGINYVGGNEIWAKGSSGGYNWSKAESWTFETGPVFYVAAWSDNSVAQGLLAQVFKGDGTSLHTGNAAWEVFATGFDAGDGTPHPTAAWVTEKVALADSASAWEAPFVGGANGIAPWSTIAGITSDSRWTWWNNPGKSNSLIGGSGAGELLIFRVSVPAPGAAATAALGLTMLARRRRG